MSLSVVLVLALFAGGQLLAMGDAPAPPSKIQKAPRKSPLEWWLMKKPVWERELDRALQNLSLRPVPYALQENHRCQIDIQGERILQNLCRHYLNEEAVEASALTIRFLEALRCLDPNQLMELDAAFDGFFEILSRRNDRAARQVIASLTNVAISVIDMFPNARQPVLRKRLKDDRNLIVTSLETFGLEDAGLWCSNRLGTNYNFRKTCSARSKSGKFLKGTCVDPAVRMVEAYADESALGLGTCGCSEMILNGGLCDIHLPPCMGDGSSGSSGEAGGATPIDFGPGFGSGQGNMTEFLGQFSGSDLMAMSCGQQDPSSGGGDSLGGLSPAGGCNYREMLVALVQALEDPIEQEARCVREGLQEQRQGEIFVQQEDAYMDRACMYGEGEGEGDGQPPEPPTQEQCSGPNPPSSCPNAEQCSGPNPPSNCSNSDACSDAPDPQACRDARQQGQDRANLPSHQNAIQRQCQAARGRECTQGEIDRARQTAAEVANQRSQNVDEIQLREGRADGAYIPSTGQMIIRTGMTTDWRTWAHEIYHATADALGVNVDSGGNLIDDHDHMPPGIRDIPDGPGFEDRCAGNDLRNNVIFQCTIAAEQEGEEEGTWGPPREVSPSGGYVPGVSGGSPRTQPVPDDSGTPSPQVIAALQILQACDRSAGGNMMDAVNQYCQQVAGGDTPDDPPDVCLQRPGLCDCGIHQGGSIFLGIGGEFCDPAREACGDPSGEESEDCPPGTSWGCSFGREGVVCGCQQGGSGLGGPPGGGDPEGGFEWRGPGGGEGPTR